MVPDHLYLPKLTRKHPFGKMQYSEPPKIIYIALLVFRMSVAMSLFCTDFQFRVLRLGLHWNVGNWPFCEEEWAGLGGLLWKKEAAAATY